MSYWKSALLKALSSNKQHMPYAKYVQFATVSTDGRPRCRTVVFRGFLTDSPSDREGALTFCTDGRSRKVEELAATPYAEVCWYFPGSREQFRLHGRVTDVGPGYPEGKLRDVRKRVWKNMTDGARAQFLWLSPGTPREASHALPQPETPTDPDCPLDTFHLLVVHCSEVEIVRLRDNSRERWVSAGEGEAFAWQMIELNP